MKVFMGHRALKTAPVLRFEREDGIRLAVVRCPHCSEEHRHVYPDDTFPGATGQRAPRCRRGRPDYAITITEETR